MFVVFLKIELDNVVNENYSSQIVEAKITVYESLRVRPVTDHKFLEGKIESLTMRKSYSSQIFIQCGQLLRRLNVSMTICYYSLCGEHSRSKIIFLGKTYHRKVVIVQIKGKP